MSRRPSLFRQTDLARAIRTAKASGAPGVEVRMGDVVLWIPLTEPAKANETVAQTGEIVL